MGEQRQYIAIDLKSFYASVECKERGLDPLTTNLVVADPGRTEKTICLAVSPSLKAYGIPGRARLFEVVQKVREVNASRVMHAKGRKFEGESYNSIELATNPSLAVGYLVAPPKMAKYIKYSTDIYRIYLNYVAPEDIHVYSIDEVFIDVTDYLKTYNLSARELAMKMIKDVLATTGVTATAGIGTNLYLCKIAMDIVAKHIPADEDGVRIAELDEMGYRRKLWAHEPITDFWRVGHGIAKKLSQYGIHTMGDIARCSLGDDNDFHNEELLYKLFGVNAELLIDHAWGYEPCTIKQVKSYKPEVNSICSGQVLLNPYDYAKARIVLREMTDMLVLDLVGKRLVTDQVVLTIGYDKESLTNPEICEKYEGQVTLDRYGRKVPAHAHGTGNIGHHSSSTKEIMDVMLDLYDRIVDRNLLIRRINITANNVISEEQADNNNAYEQLSLFDTCFENESDSADEEQRSKEKSLQKAMIAIREKYGKNAILKGTSLQEGATAMERNNQIGGHRA